MKYTEKMTDSTYIKEQYLSGIKNLIEDKLKEAEKNRTEYISGIFENPEKYIDDLKETLGWPLNEREETVNLEFNSEKISDEDDFDIYRMQIEVMHGINLSGLLFKKKDEKKRPLILTLHGSLGSPELVAGFFENDKGSYNSLIDRVMKFDVNVFAPQLLIWHTKESFRDYGVKFDRNEIDTKLKMVGGSAAALEIYSIMRVIDFFEKESYVSAFGMIGHSYGGFYTLYTAALDKRITASICNAYFNDCTKVTKPDWAWRNCAHKFCNAEVAALVYPRKIFFQMGTQDILFNYKDSEKEFERLKKICDKVGTEWTQQIIFDGIHEFNRDDTAIDLLMNELTKAN